MAKQAKIAEIQYLRGFAFLAVVLQHSIGHYAYLPESGLADGVLLAILLIAAKFAVPVFVFITGLVLFYNYRSSVAYGSFLWKRCKDIVLPYLVWSLVYALIVKEPGTGIWTEVKRIFPLLATGTASYHLWYVVMSIQLYFLFPPVQRAVLSIRRHWKAWQLTALFLLLAVGYVLLTSQVSAISGVAEKLGIPLLTPLFTEYADRNAFYFFIYFIMGAAVGLNVQDWKRRVMGWKAGWLFLYLACAADLLYSIVASFRTEAGMVIQYNKTLLIQPYMAVFLMLSIISMGVAAVAVQHSAGLAVKRLLNVLGHYSYGAYLAHALMLTFSTYFADSLFPLWNVSLRTMVAFVLCTWLSVAVTALLGRLRWTRLVSGSPKPFKQA